MCTCRHGAVLGRSHKGLLDFGKHRADTLNVPDLAVPVLAGLLSPAVDIHPAAGKAHTGNQA